MTQEELAEKLSTYRRTVSRWETGRNLPDIDILLEMAELFNVELIEIIDGEIFGGDTEKQCPSADKRLKIAVVCFGHFARKLIQQLRFSACPFEYGGHFYGCHL